MEKSSPFTLRSPTDSRGNLAYTMSSISEDSNKQNFKPIKFGRKKTRDNTFKET